MHTHVCIKLHDHFNWYLFWGVRHILTDGKYKLGDCTIIITCTKARKISIVSVSSHVLSTIYSYPGYRVQCILRYNELKLLWTSELLFSAH